jgi:hypothetical protein
VSFFFLFNKSLKLHIIYIFNMQIPDIIINEIMGSRLNRDTEKFSVKEV